ncbi:unnamed protein product [Prorocentrum cordatum]|uniref:RanBP2-type domain-containing protein n=1 Tax=Prorocentrum cordatum TaxID=2364126 RepID=A0ABN9VWJ5_9DINO|nr:unnamed protein product [Polarella glacialis]
MDVRAMTSQQVWAETPDPRWRGLAAARQTRWLQEDVLDLRAELDRLRTPAGGRGAALAMAPAPGRPAQAPLPALLLLRWPRRARLAGPFGAWLRMALKDRRVERLRRLHKRIVADVQMRLCALVLHTWRAGRSRSIGSRRSSAQNAPSCRKTSSSFVTSSSVVLGKSRYTFDASNSTGERYSWSRAILTFSLRHWILKYLVRTRSVVAAAWCASITRPEGISLPFCLVLLVKAFHGCCTMEARAPAVAPNSLPRAMWFQSCACQSAKAISARVTGDADGVAQPAVAEHVGDQPPGRVVLLRHAVAAGGCSGRAAASCLRGVLVGEPRKRRRSGSHSAGVAARAIPPGALVPASAPSSSAAEREKETTAVASASSNTDGIRRARMHFVMALISGGSTSRQNASRRDSGILSGEARAEPSANTPGAQALTTLAAGCPSEVPKGFSLGLGDDAHEDASKHPGILQRPEDLLHGGILARGRALRCRRRRGGNGGLECAGAPLLHQLRREPSGGGLLHDARDKLSPPRGLQLAAGSDRGRQCLSQLPLRVGGEFRGDALELRVESFKLLGAQDSVPAQADERVESAPLQGDAILVRGRALHDREQALQDLPEDVFTKVPIERSKLRVRERSSTQHWNVGSASLVEGVPRYCSRQRLLSGSRSRSATSSSARRECTKSRLASCSNGGRGGESLPSQPSLPTTAADCARANWAIPERASACTAADGYLSRCISVGEQLGHLAVKRVAALELRQLAPGAEREGRAASPGPPRRRQQRGPQLRCAHGAPWRLAHCLVRAEEQQPGEAGLNEAAAAACAGPGAQHGAEQECRGDPGSGDPGAHSRLLSCSMGYGSGKATGFIDCKACGYKWNWANKTECFKCKAKLMPSIGAPPPLSGVWAENQKYSTGWSKFGRGWAKTAPWRKHGSYKFWNWEHKGEHDEAAQLADPLSTTSLIASLASYQCDGDETGPTIAAAMDTLRRKAQAEQAAKTTPAPPKPRTGAQLLGEANRALKDIDHHIGKQRHKLVDAQLYLDDQEEYMAKLERPRAETLQQQWGALAQASAESGIEVVKPEEKVGSGALKVNFEFDASLFEGLEECDVTPEEMQSILR